MALGVAKVHDPDVADRDDGVFDVTFDNSYPALGYPVSGATFGRKSLHSCIPVQKGVANRLITYDPSVGDGGTLRIWTAIGTEAVAATDQSTISCRCRVSGPVI
jgi:hypothetical protein